MSQVESQASVARDNVATPTSSNNLKGKLSLYISLEYSK